MHKLRGKFDWVWLVVPLASGCAADESSDESYVQGIEYGGQTGALLPPIDEGACGPRVGPDGVLTLSAGDALFVALGAPLDLLPTPADAGVADRGMDGGVTADWVLEDSNGEVVPLTSEGDTELPSLRPAEALFVGAYTLSYSCEGVSREVPVEVVAAPVEAPPPLVGRVELAYDPSAYSCGSIEQRVTLLLYLSEAGTSVADNTQLSLESEALGVDLVIAPYGSIDPRSASLELGVPICVGTGQTNCLPQGSLALNLVSEVLGRPLETVSFPLRVDTGCIESGDVEPEPTAEGPGYCGVVRSFQGRPSGFVELLLALSLTGAGLVRRRTRSSI